MLDVCKANRRETEEPVFPSQAHDFAGSELVITEALRTPDITKQSLLCSKFLLFQPENSLLPILVFTCFLKTRIEGRKGILVRYPCVRGGTRRGRRATGHLGLRAVATCSAASAPVGLGPQQGRTPPEAPSAETQLSAWIFMGRFVVPGRYGDRMTQAECSYRAHPGRSVSQCRSPARVRAPSQGTLACPRGPGGRPVNVCLTGE